MKGTKKNMRQTFIRLTRLSALLISSLLQAEVETFQTPADTMLSVHWIFEEDFNDANWQERWFVETQGPRVFTEGGLLKVRARDNNRQQAGVTVWSKKELPEDIVIEVWATTEAEIDNNACNLNFFIHAREADGTKLQLGRQGIYKEYHDLINHLITFTGGITPGWSRARLNPGFQLIHEDKSVRAEPGQSYHFIITIVGKNLSYFINGDLIHSYNIEQPLSAGHFGLRTWFSQVNYEKVRIGHILESDQ